MIEFFKRKPETLVDLPKRRTMLGLLATAAAGVVAPALPATAQDATPAIPPEQLALPSVEAREAIIDASLQRFTSPEAKRICESGSDAEIIALLTSYPEFLTRADDPFFAGTKFDPMPAIEKHGFPSSQIRETDLADYMSTGATTAVGNLHENTIAEFASGGNLFVAQHVGERGKENTVLSNEHVATSLGLPVLPGGNAELDIRRLKVPLGTRGLPPAIIWDPSILPENMTGTLVFNPVIKSDPSAPQHHKVRAGIAIQLTEHLVDFMLRHSSKIDPQQVPVEVHEKAKAQLLRSYVVVSSEWEQAEQSMFFLEAGKLHVSRFTNGQGTSGSPWVIVTPQNELRLTGIHFAGTTLRYGVFNEHSIHLSIYHGSDGIRETLTPRVTK